MPPAVSPQFHSHLAVVQDMKEGLSTLLTEAADIAILLMPEMEVGIRWEAIDRRIDGKLHHLGWEAPASTQNSGEFSPHNLAISP